MESTTLQTVTVAVQVTEAPQQTERPPVKWDPFPKPSGWAMAWSNEGLSYEVTHQGRTASTDADKI